MEVTSPVGLPNRNRGRHLVAGLLGWIPLIATLVAVGMEPDWLPRVWQAMPLLGSYAVWFVAMPLVLAVLVSRQRILARATVFATIALLIGFCMHGGLAQLAALALFLASAAVVGGRFVSGVTQDSVHPLPLSFVTLGGSAAIVGLVAWLLPFRVHSAGSYLVASALLLCWQHEALRSGVRGLARDTRGLLQRYPGWMLATAWALGLASVLTWLPTLGYDDNSGHLLLAEQLRADGYYRMDVSTHAGALTPWLNNVLHGILSVTSGGDARPAVGLFWLLVGVTGAYRLARALDADEPVAFAAAILYASHPLTGYFGTTLQVDGPSAAAIMHLVAFALPRDKRQRGAWILAGAIAGLLAGMKITNAIYLLPVAVVLGWRLLRARDWTGFALLGASALLVAGSCYAYAAIVTGNPVFPFYNALFQSPYFPAENFLDSRWQGTFRLSSLWNITLHTDRFMEAYPGAAGIVLLALAGGIPLALMRRDRLATVAVLALATGVAVFWQVQYLRYVFPALAVFTTVALVALARGMHRHAGLVVVLLVAFFQFGLLRTTSWILDGGAADNLLAHDWKSRAALEVRYAPERVLMRTLEQDGREFCLLSASPEAPYIAEAGGQAASTGWYDWRMSSAALWANEDPSGVRWATVFERTGITHVQARMAATPLALRAGLERAGFASVDTAGEATLWARPGADASACALRLFGPRNEALRRLRP